MKIFYNFSSFQDKVLAELDSIFGDDKERPVTTADLPQMKYLEYCIKESLRLFPSVPFFARSLKQDLKLGKVTAVASHSLIQQLYAGFMV